RTVAECGLTALMAFLMIRLGCLPRSYALSLAVTVPVPGVAVTVPVLPYSPSGAGKLTTPDEVYSHTSFGSSLPFLFRSPLTYFGEKSSAVVAVPLSSRSAVIGRGVVPG